MRFWYSFGGSGLFLYKNVCYSTETHVSLKCVDVWKVSADKMGYLPMTSFFLSCESCCLHNRECLSDEVAKSSFFRTSFGADILTQILGWFVLLPGQWPVSCFFQNINSQWKAAKSSLGIGGQSWAALTCSNSVSFVIWTRLSFPHFPWLPRASWLLTSKGKGDFKGWTGGVESPCFYWFGDSNLMCFHNFVCMWIGFSSWGLFLFSCSSISATFYILSLAILVNTM